MMNGNDLDNQVLAETDNFVIWRTDDDPEGFFYHIALGGVTLHLDAEEWNELALLVKSADS